jgi:hypothetical protein
MWEMSHSFGTADISGSELSTSQKKVGLRVADKYQLDPRGCGSSYCFLNRILTINEELELVLSRMEMEYAISSDGLYGQVRKCRSV